MPDDRHDLHETAAEWDDDGEPTPEEQAEEDRWFAENVDWIKSKVDEAVNDPRPTISLKQAFEDVHDYIDELFRKRDGDA